MRYHHVQRGWFQFLLYAASLFLFGLVWFTEQDQAASIGLTCLAFLFFAFGLGFETLTISDESDSLLLAFGPLPLFRKRFRYSDITDATTGRSSFMDGWGIHYVPFRGWTYNLWGFDCVVLQLGSKTVRIGTDDAGNLLAFLKGQIGTG